MTLLRSTARTMLASYFVVSGLKAVRDPESLVPAAEPLVDGVVPQIQRFAPEQVSSYVPTDAKTWVRINGVLELVGGIALATGKGRRLGAGLLALSLVPTTDRQVPVLESQSDPAERAADRDHFLKNLSLLGGVLIASRDTEGTAEPRLPGPEGWSGAGQEHQRPRRRHEEGQPQGRQGDQGDHRRGAGRGCTAGRRGGRHHAEGSQAGRQAAEGGQERRPASRRRRPSRLRPRPPSRLRRTPASSPRQTGKSAGKQLEAAKKEAGKQLAAAKKSAQGDTENIQLGEN